METKTEKDSTVSQERSIKELSPRVAGLLCYVAGWISGIIFLVLEQKNRFVRFHALQSIIVFGILTLANIVFGSIPWAGTGFSVIIGITAFILWIILMVKANSGEMFKLPWAGNLAERLANESIPPSTRPPAQHPPANQPPSAQPSSAQPPSSRPPSTQPLSNTVTPEPPPSARTEEMHSSPPPEYIRPAARPVYQDDTFIDKYYSTSQRNARMAGSAFAIAWGVVLLIFFNFYNQYIAWYEPVHSGGSTQWQMHTLVTSDFAIWLPVVTATLVISIIGHAVAITFDRYALRQTIRTILDALSAVSVITLLVIFPFDFSVLPSTAAADGTTFGLTIALICIAVICGISALVNLVQLIIHSVKGEY